MGYIYLIREREFINNNKQIYKIGRTDSYDVRTRLKDYPSDSEVLFFIKVKNSKDVEKRLLKEFDKYFENKKKIGREYYQGNPDHMIVLICEDCDLKYIKLLKLEELNQGWGIYKFFSSYFF